MSLTRVIDLHAHFAPAGPLQRLGVFVRDHAGPRVRLGERWQPVPESLLDPDRLLADAEAVGISTRVMSLPPFLLRHDLPATEAVDYSRAMNDGLAADAARDAGRLRVLATVPLQHPTAAAAELHRAVEHLGCHGAIIATRVAGSTELDAPDLDPFWTAAETLGALVFIHPHDVAGAGHMQDYHLRNLVGNPLETTLAAARLVFGGVLIRHPGLRILLAHGGGALPWLAGRLDRGFQVRPECRTMEDPPSAWLRRFVYDTVLFEPRRVRALIEWVGADHVVLGTDYPFDMSDPDAVGTITGAIDDRRALEAVLSGNAVRLLSAGRHSTGTSDLIEHAQERGGGMA